MFPIYSYSEGYPLSEDDVEGIQFLYGTCTFSLVPSFSDVWPFDCLDMLWSMCCCCSSLTLMQPPPSWNEMQARTRIHAKCIPSQWPQTNVTQCWHLMRWQSLEEKQWSSKGGVSSDTLFKEKYLYENVCLYTILLFLIFWFIGGSTALVHWFDYVCFDSLLFLGRFYWRVHPNMAEPELALIKSTWPMLPNKVDAAFENPHSDRVFIFSGRLCLFPTGGLNRVTRWMLGFKINAFMTVLCYLTGIRMWALSGYDLVEGYPKYIHKLGLPKTIRKVDAAVYIPDTGKTLLFTEEEYWRWALSLSFHFLVPCLGFTSVYKRSWKLFQLSRHVLMENTNWILLLFTAMMTTQARWRVDIQDPLKVISLE